MTRGGCKHFNTPEVHMNSGPGGKMAVAWPTPCPITAEMAHDWLGWNGVILKGSGGGHVNNEMNERTAPYNQKSTWLFLSAGTGIRELFVSRSQKVAV